MKSSFSQLISGDVPVLIDVYAEWCGPCKMMPPILQKVKAELGTQIRIVKIDSEKNPAIMKKFSIRGVPTLLLFKNGDLKWRQSGVVPEDQIISVIKSI